jgi:hypothetical protein
MTEEKMRNVFAGPRVWGGAAHRQKLPFDVPGGPRRGDVANVLAFRNRTGVTTVTVTWPVAEQPNLLKAEFEYGSPREALDAGWALGEYYEADATFMERMARTYGDRLIGPTSDS